MSSFKLNPAHKGWCTPLSNPHCTGRRRQFALNAKNHFKKHAEGGSVNNTGYLKGHPTANNEYNIIPTGNITTEGMAFPILANGIPLFPNTGNYQFPTNRVYETPLRGRKKQRGGPTSADSLALYNNSKQVQDYYDKRGYTKTKQDTPRVMGMKNGEELYGYMKDQAEMFKGTGSSAKTPNGREIVDDYRTEVDKNKYYQREIANTVLDTRAPRSLFDRRILPQYEMSYSNNNPRDRMMGDQVDVFQYDPIAIKPYNMLTPEEKAIRDQKYPKPVQPKVIPKPQPKPIPPVQMNPTQVAGIQPNQNNINIQPQQFGQLQTMNPGFTYGQIPPGPYAPESGRSVYNKGQLVGYQDSKGNAVDASHFGISTPMKRLGGLKRKQAGGINTSLALKSRQDAVGNINPGVSQDTMNYKSPEDNGNPLAALSALIPLANGIGVNLANSHEWNQQQSYRENFNNPMSLLPQYNGQSQGVKYGYDSFKRGGMRRYQDGGDTLGRDMFDELDEQDQDQHQEQPVEDNQQIAQNEDLSNDQEYEMAMKYVMEDYKIPNLDIPQSSDDDSSSVSLRGNNTNAALQYLRGKGLPQHVAAGIVGNLSVESNVNPRAYNPNDLGKPSFGIAQWRGERLNALKNWSNRSGRDVNDLHTQLDYLLQEGSQRGDIQKAMAARDVNEATNIFGRNFERPKDTPSTWTKRQNAARNLLK